MPALKSWIASANGHKDFPAENLPFGVFSHAASGRDPRIGVAIGESVLDLRALAAEGLLDNDALCESTLNAFMGQTRAEWRAARARVGALLTEGGDDALSKDAAAQARCVVPRDECAMHLPATVGDYTDFYSSREHATNVGIMFRGKDNALQPNWLHLPVGYHGRASSVVPSGTPVTRPKGQIQLDKTDPTKGTEHIACRLLDFELEMGFFVGGAAKPLGDALTMAEAEEHIFGYVLCNDWSARDIQKFEYVPLGPFGAKNFATTISPWVVMCDALEPFRCETSAKAQTDPVPLEYLREENYSSYNLELAVEVAPAGGQFTTITNSNFRNMYWTPRQQLVHHSVTGCDMRPADLLASGTISGQTESPPSYGSMLELCWQGTKEIGPLADGSIRKFLKDGDTVNMRGTCAGVDYSIGFGDCSGQVLPAGEVAPPPPAPPVASALRDVSLSSYWRSSSAWRVRVALAFYGVPYTYNAVNLLKGEQAATSEMAQVPRLDWADGGGVRHSLTQSLAIIEFLCDTCDAPGAPSLRPRDAVTRARARAVAEIVNSGTQPLQNLSHCKAMQAAAGEGVDMKKAVAKPAIEKGLAAVETALQANPDRRYCVGSAVTVADLALVPQLYNARRFEVDLAPYERCLAVEAHVTTLPAFAAADPSAQPDAVKQ